MSVHLPFWPSLSSVSIKCYKKPFSSFFSNTLMIFIFFFFTSLLLLYLTKIKLLVLSLRNTAFI